MRSAGRPTLSWPRWHSLMVKADWIKPGAIVIDVGINRLDADLGENPEGLSGTWTLTIIVPSRVRSRRCPEVSVP